MRATRIVCVGDCRWCWRVELIRWAVGGSPKLQTLAIAETATKSERSPSLKCEPACQGETCWLMSSAVSPIAACGRDGACGMIPPYCQGVLNRGVCPGGAHCTGLDATGIGVMDGPTAGCSDVSVLCRPGFACGVAADGCLFCLGDAENDRLRNLPRWSSLHESERVLHAEDLRQLGASCGSPPDGCGGVLHRGDCGGSSCNLDYTCAFRMRPALLPGSAA